MAPMIHVQSNGGCPQNDQGIPRIETAAEKLSRPLTDTHRISFLPKDPLTAEKVKFNDSFRCQNWGKVTTFQECLAKKHNITSRAKVPVSHSTSSITSELADEYRAKENLIRRQSLFQRPPNTLLVRNTSSHGVFQEPMYSIDNTFVPAEHFIPQKITLLPHKFPILPQSHTLATQFYRIPEEERLAKLRSKLSLSTLSLYSRQHARNNLGGNSNPVPDKLARKQMHSMFGNNIVDRNLQNTMRFNQTMTRLFGVPSSADLKRILDSKDQQSSSSSSLGNLASSASRSLDHFASERGSAKWKKVFYSIILGFRLANIYRQISDKIQKLTWAPCPSEGLIASHLKRFQSNPADNHFSKKVP